VASVGIVVIGGLTSSTVFTLFISPIFYSYADKETRKMHKKYMTQDGDVITQKEIDAKKREEERSQKEDADNEYDYESRNTEKNAAPQAPEVEENQNDSYINEMQKLLDRMKNDKSDK